MTLGLSMNESRLIEVISAGIGQVSVFEMGQYEAGADDVADVEDHVGPALVRDPPQGGV
ncbi:hypothetical protein AB0J68_03310 [Micromonospora sp. NPDC049580]|uniref:hypothetical protein n=1 Tax=Micromonospora sp. NPDC049580 TaxID=3154832 RepID=UPI003417C3F7